MAPEKDRESNVYNLKQNGWNEWARYVLLELDRLDDGVKSCALKADTVSKEASAKIEEHHNKVVNEIREITKDIRDDIKSIERDIVSLKVKAGIWGLIGGSVPTLIAIILWLLEFHARK